jgi:aromatic-L-amino-acid decarboxylase
MMDTEAFKKHAHQFVDWMGDYLAQVTDHPVKSQVKAREIFDQLPPHPPTEGEPMDAIFKDFQQIILPGITHWQSPNFFAYFPANASYPSLLAEMLTATLAAQCMIWDTSPAAAELEEKALDWLREMCGLPSAWQGVIQDTASSATLCALLTAREQASQYGINQRGFSGAERFRIYGSTETHSSIDKAVKIAGFGVENLVKVAVDENLALRPEALAEAIRADREAGFHPLCVISTLGTTSTTAMDPLRPIGEICQREGLWHHVDAAFAGTAMILPEHRHWLDGVELADSYVFNPHKWMFTHFDCTAYYVKDHEALIRTFSILPEYLKTDSRGQVNDYRDWGVALGRRFRALKLWFVIRSFGVEGIRQRLRQHIAWAGELAGWIEKAPDFELMADHPLSLVCFRYHPEGVEDLEQLNALNAELNRKLNASGKIYLTHTKIRGAYSLRMVTAQTYLKQEQVAAAWQLIREMADLRI